MTSLASGRLAERPVSVAERQQLTAFQESVRAHLTLRARRRYDDRRKCCPTGSARVKWGISMTYALESASSFRKIWEDERRKG